MIPRQNYTTLEIADMLREAGLSATRQRMGLCHYLLCEARHPTVEDIRHWAENNGIKASLATIYNTLHALCNAGYMKDLRFPHLANVIYDNNVEPHHHFLDVESGKIFDIPLDKFKISGGLNDDFEVQNVELLIQGNYKNK